VPNDIWVRVHRPVAPIAAVLVDLAEHLDARARRVAQQGARRLDRDRVDG
jgi:hypothetical protein